MRVALESRWAWGALAVVAGAVPALAFPAPALWWLAYAALVPWMLLARAAPTGRRAAFTGWLGGTGFMLAVHHWLLPSLHVFILVLAALLGLLWAPWGWLVRRLLEGRPGPARLAAAVLLLPSAWLMVELVRSWQGLGGPWGLLGASQWQVTPALRLASVGGVWLISFVVVAVNTSLAALLAARGAPTRLPAVSAVSALAAVAVVVGGTWAWVPLPEEESGDSLRVGVVQSGGGMSADARFTRNEELSRSLAREHHGLDLIVWGESSVGYDLAEHPRLRARLAALSRATGAEILVNVDARRSDKPGIFKSSVLAGPDGLTGERYDKMRLVPFGEYVPARWVLGWVTSVGRAAGEDRRRGTEPVLMRADGVRFGPLVCFETAFPDMSRHLAGEGARVLVAQSSTSSFQNSWAPQQHASLAALRAAETWRPMVHATLTGVSAVHGPRGEAVGERLGTDRSAAASYSVPMATGTSPYVRLGDWVIYLTVTSLLVYGAAEALRALREGRRGAVTSPAPARQ
ncbi:apolipoprotein N-acyltransferase [Streptomyces sp. NPDC054796]